MAEVVRIERLDVEGLRKLSAVRLVPAPGVNWIQGANGAGKTTLLEAVFLLSRGKSFRSSKHGPLAQDGRSGFRVAARVRIGERVREIEVRRQGAETRWAENGVPKAGPKEITLRMQVRMVGENAQKLIEGDPDLRRMFLDWNLFHVEPGYSSLLVDFRRALAQRNAWLREGGRGRAVWDSPYVERAVPLTARRSEYVSRLVTSLGHVLHELRPEFGATLRLAPGWPPGRDLRELLEETRGADVQRGFTYYGPGRADLDIRLVAHRHRRLPSRGQSKFLVAALQLAAQRIWSTAGLSCIWLLDDLPAELDQDSLERLLAAFPAEGMQVLTTTLHPPTSRGAVFHVEQGTVHAPSASPANRTRV